MRLFVLALAAVSAFAAGELSNRRAPGFSLPDQNLKQVDLADYRGRVVLLDFMRTDCPHCRALALLLEQAKSKYRDQIEVLSIVTQPDDLNSVAKFKSANRVTTTVLFDCGQVAASYLKVTPARPQVTLPHLFLVDREGVIRSDFLYDDTTKAFFNSPAFYAEIEKLLGSGKAPGSKKK